MQSNNDLMMQLPRNTPSAHRDFARPVQRLHGYWRPCTLPRKQGALTQLAVTSALPADFKGAKSGAEILLHPNGKFLYASNRGDSNTIAMFRIGADGLPQPAGYISSGGKRPRFFGLDPAGRFLIAAHQESDDLFVLRINPDTGNEFLIPSPASGRGAGERAFAASRCESFCYPL